jgi:hypothetical protein
LVKAPPSGGRPSLFICKQPPIFPAPKIWPWAQLELNRLGVYSVCLLTGIPNFPRIPSSEIMKYLGLSAVAAIASLVSAQIPDSCILSCVGQVCPTFPSDVSCFCVTGQAAIADCLVTNCTSADLSTAQTLGAQYCCTSQSPIQTTFTFLG